MSHISSEDSALLSEDEDGSTDPSHIQSALPLIGELIAFINSGLILFTILSMLKLEGVLTWMWWWICIPLWLILFVLLLLTQSKKITSRTSLIVRLAWILFIISILSFLVLINLRLEQEYDLPWGFVFLPLWILLLFASILGISGVIVACCNREERRRRKYLSSGVPLILFVMIFIPFTLLLEHKLQEDDDSVVWSAVFIPLWLVDSISICFACVLMLFTIGSREDAVFTLSQVATFICLMPLAILFKLLLVINLEGNSISYFIVMAPLLVMELLALSCGLNLRYSKHKRKKLFSHRKDQRAHVKLKSNAMD